MLRYITSGPHIHSNFTILRFRHIIITACKKLRSSWVGLQWYRLIIFDHMAQALKDDTHTANVVMS
jgi:hypothetical protein